MLFFGGSVLTAAFDAGCYSALQLQVRCFGVLCVCFGVCVSGQPRAQTSSSVAVTSKYSRGIYHTFIVEGLKAN